MSLVRLWKTERVIHFTWAIQYGRRWCITIDKGQKRGAAALRLGQPIPETHPHIFRASECFQSSLRALSCAAPAQEERGGRRRPGRSDRIVTPYVSLSEYENRRTHLFEQLPPHSILLVTAKDEAHFSNDIFYSFKQDAFFDYLFGCREPMQQHHSTGGGNPTSARKGISKMANMTCAVFAKTVRGNCGTLLFVAPKNSVDEKWGGSRTGPREAERVFLGMDRSSSDSSKREPYESSGSGDCGCPEWFWSAFGRERCDTPLEPPTGAMDNNITTIIQSVLQLVTSMAREKIELEELYTDDKDKSRSGGKQASSGSASFQSPLPSILIKQPESAFLSGYAVKLAQGSFDEAHPQCSSSSSSRSSNSGFTYDHPFSAVLEFLFAYKMNYYPCRPLQHTVARRPSQPGKEKDMATAPSIPLMICNYHPNVSAVLPLFCGALSTSPSLSAPSRACRDASALALQQTFPQLLAHTIDCRVDPEQTAPSKREVSSPATSTTLSRVASTAAAAHVGRPLVSALSLMWRVRSIKTATEVGLHWRSAHVTAYAFECAMRRSGQHGARSISEHDVAQALQDSFSEWNRGTCPWTPQTREWAYRGIALDAKFAYVPVVAGGANALALHYVSNNAMMSAGRADDDDDDGGSSEADASITDDSFLLRVDAGSEVFGSTPTDCTRTFPFGSKSFSSHHARVYDAVLRMQRRLLQSVGAGETVRSIATQAMDEAFDVLQELGIVKSASHSHGINEVPRMAMLSREAVRQLIRTVFFPHDFGHFFGRDLHEHVLANGSSPIEFAAGMMHTVEPGIYIPTKSVVQEAILEALKRTSTSSESATSQELFTCSVPTLLENVGVQIEDDVLVLPPQALGSGGEPNESYVDAAFNVFLEEIHTLFSRNAHVSLNSPWWFNRWKQVSHNDISTINAHSMAAGKLKNLPCFTCCRRSVARSLSYPRNDRKGSSSLEIFLCEIYQDVHALESLRNLFVWLQSRSIVGEVNEEISFGIQRTGCACTSRLSPPSSSSSLHSADEQCGRIACYEENSTSNFKSQWTGINGTPHWYPFRILVLTGETAKDRADIEHVMTPFPIK